MSYLALARKWRPRTFAQLVGQEQVNKALANSLNRQQLHHAYLFTGTRGVGKTSVARLLAKALNCEEGISAEPCLHCDTCLAVEQGRFIDLIEIDGASKTRVEDTRELLENVQYKPSHGRFKIYLIDEVHMLSQHSFNALLKTLEEPPAHVKFLLATTDPQKLPVTVLSRCLQFHLRHLTPDIIEARLQHILNAESLPFEPEALTLLAKAAKGSMRDALSLLDQAIASTQSSLKLQEIKAILGYTQQDYALRLLQALAQTDAQALIVESRQIAAEGGYFRYVLDEMLDYLHQMTLIQCLATDKLLLSYSQEIRALANQFTPEDLQLFYQMSIKGLEEMHLAPTLAIGFEMVLLRMLTFKPATRVAPPVLAHEQKTEILPGYQETISPQVEETVDDISSDKPEPLAKEALSSPVIQEQEDWLMILSKLKLTGLTQNAAENAEFLSKSGRDIMLRVAKGHQSLFTPAVCTRIEEALAVYYHEPIKIALSSDEPVQSSPAQQKQKIKTLKQQEAENMLQQDPFFLELKESFSAELVKNSIVSAEDEL